MTKYSTKESLNELSELESRVLSRTEDLLRNKNCRGVAEILISIDNEIYQTEREARKLRLMGRLDYEVYRSLIDGYVEIQKHIIELSEKYGLDGEVKSMYQFLRVEESLAKRKA